MKTTSYNPELVGLWFINNTIKSPLNNITSRTDVDIIGKLEKLQLELINYLIAKKTPLLFLHIDEQYSKWVIDKRFSVEPRFLLALLKHKNLPIKVFDKMCEVYKIPESTLINTFMVISGYDVWREENNNINYHDYMKNYRNEDNK